MHAVVGAGEAAMRLPLPAGDTDVSLLPFRDSEVLLGIRPECIAEVRRRFGAEDLPPMLVNATVEMTELTGAETIVRLRLAEQPLIGRVAADTRLKLGAVEKFSIDTRKLCLFDPRSERLIA